MIPPRWGTPAVLGACVLSVVTRVAYATRNAAWPYLLGVCGLVLAGCCAYLAWTVVDDIRHR